MGTLVPAQNYDHVLNIVSGSNGMHDLQFVAAPASGQTFYRGSLVTLNSVGQLIKGITTQHDMPMWAINATGDFDVESDIGNVSGGNVGCFVATGGYEIFTTEFVAGTYAPNTMLTAATSGNAGKVTAAAATYSDTVVVGCVSRGTSTGIYDQSLLYFWPMFMPAYSTEVEEVSEAPSEEPSAEASEEPSAEASEEPSAEASEEPSAEASEEPSAEASEEPSV
jgi:hypothetical protein